MKYLALGYGCFPPNKLRASKKMVGTLPCQIDMWSLCLNSISQSSDINNLCAAVATTDAATIAPLAPELSLSIAATGH